MKFTENKKFYYVLSNILSTNLEKNIFIWKINTYVMTTTDLLICIIHMHT